MVFSSKLFLFLFFPVLFVFYYGEIKKGKGLSIKARNIILLCASILFYAYGEPKFVFIMILCIIVNWFLAILLQSTSCGARRKRIFIFAIAIDVAVLFVCKYLNFAVSNINNAFGLSIHLKEIALPIGISFYTFQMISYVVDVYNKKVEASKNLLEVMLYISMFPQLIAGPIVRYKTIEAQLKDRHIDNNNIVQGFTRFVIGLSKKVLLADVLSDAASFLFLKARFVDISILAAWFGAICFTLQIYFDFSGYSDMAIGLGKIFGFDFEENFNYPYISKSITEFWRRWHISLSSWLKDYIYIPLGGSKVKNITHIRNLLIVWLVTGLWHGANWTFILWGLWYFVFIIIEKYLLNKTRFFKCKIIPNLYTMIVVVIGWVFFSSSSVSAAFDYIATMFGATSAGVSDIFFSVALKEYRVILPVALIAMLPIKKVVNAKFGNKKYYDVIKAFWVLILFICSVLCIFSHTYSPFIYFNF